MRRPSMMSPVKVREYVLGADGGVMMDILLASRRCIQISRAKQKRASSVCTSPVLRAAC